MRVKKVRHLFTCSAVEIIRKITLSFLSLAIIVAVVIPAALAQQRTVRVVGRTVDERGAPIPKAIVSLYTPPCHNCIDHVLPAASSLFDGFFVIDSDGISLKNLKLFVSGPVPAGFWSPIRDPPFAAASHLPGFQGIPIRVLKGAAQVDLGEVVVKLRYAKVIIELPKISAGKRTQPPTAFPALDLRLLDGKGTVLYSGQVPKSAFDPTFESIKLALPNGNWKLKLLLSDSGRDIASSHSISVKNLNPLRIIF